MQYIEFKFEEDFLHALNRIDPLVDRNCVMLDGNCNCPRLEGNSFPECKYLEVNKHPNL